MIKIEVMQACPNPGCQVAEANKVFVSSVLEIVMSPLWRIEF